MIDVIIIIIIMGVDVHRSVGCVGGCRMCVIDRYVPLLDKEAERVVVQGAERVVVPKSGRCVRLVVIEII